MNSAARSSRCSRPARFRSSGPAARPTRWRASPPPPSPDPHAADRVGTTIARYKLLQIIGEGGFGTVYMAEQTEPVRRKVALKVIKPGMDSRAIIARFEAERQALAMMDHPHIARVLDGGVTPLTESGGGLPYFVMEYVVGDAVTRFADAHALSIADRLELFQQVCSAVQHAHTKGIIHRDLKPANVIASMVDGKPFAKVIDFGIAKATGAAGGRLTDLSFFTEHRQLVGTPEYMSPEQAEGSLDIDTRTDVYALGVLLYELLTGTTPIEGARLRSAAFDEMRRMIREDEPLAPSMKLSRSLETLARTAAARKAEPGRLSAMVKGELDWIVLKALEKERARRYETPSALADDVRRHLAGEAVVAAPVSRTYRVRKFVRKNKGAVAASVAIAATLVVGIAGTTWGLVHARRAESRERATAVEAVQARDALKAQVQSIRGVYDTVAREIEVAARQGVFPADQPIDPASLPNARGMDPALARLETMRAYSVEWIRRAVRTHKEVQAQRDEAEWSAYTANLALAQAAMEAGDFPEARRRLGEAPESKRGWEALLTHAVAHSVRWAIRTPWSDFVFSDDGASILSWYDAGAAHTVSLAWDSSTGQSAPVLPDLPANALHALVDESGSLAFETQSRVRWQQRPTSVLSRRLARQLTGGESWLLSVSPDRQLLAWFGAPDADLRVFGTSVDVASNLLKVAPLSAAGGPIQRLARDTFENASSISLAVAVVLASSPGGPSGLTINTPDGTRRIVGGADKTVRFYEAKDGKPTLPATAEQPEGQGEGTYREVAVFRMPEAVTNLQMTGDGTRLIIHLDDGSARVWDIRDPEERRKDLQAEWAERVPAGAYLDTLWASDTPDDKLRDAVINDASLTPLRRLVAAEMLEERLEDDRLAAEDAFEKMKQAAAPATGASEATSAADPASITNAVRAAAAAADLPPRVKARVIALAAGWEYKVPEPSDAERLAEETKQRRLAEANAAMATARDYLEDVAPSSDRRQLAQAFATYEELAGRLAPETITALIAAALSQRMTLESATMLSDAAERLESVTSEPSVRLVEVWCEAAEAAAFVGRFDEAEKFYARVASSAEGVLRREGRLSLRHIPFAQYRVPGIDKVHGWMRVGFTRESAEDLQALLGYYRAARGPILRQWMAWRLSSVARYTAQAGEHAEGLELVNRAINAGGQSPSPVSVLALIRHRLSTADDATLAAAAEIDGKPGSLTGGKVLDRDGHRAAAREALAKARALMAPAADGTPSPWASDEDAKALLAEAEALVEPQP